MKLPAKDAEVLDVCAAVAMLPSMILSGAEAPVLTLELLLVRP